MSATHEKPSVGALLGGLLLRWLAFWVFTLLALAILAGGALAPLAVQRQRVRSELKVLTVTNDELAGQVKRLENRISAARSDPQYAERIIRRELNLRRPNEETLAIAPEALQAVGAVRATLDEASLADFWWIRPFLPQRKRLWLFTVGVGLLFAGVIVAVGSRSPRPSARDFS